MRGSLCLVLLLCPAATLALPPRPPAQASVNTDPLNRLPEVKEAFAHFYNLDYDGAIARFTRIRDEHPDDPIATDYLLDATVFRELYRLDLLDTTLYAHDGFLSKEHPVVENKEVTDQVDTLSDTAIRQADARLHTDDRDVNALFARAWAKSLKATYIALISHSFISALHLALAARNDDDKVLQLDPDYVDAELVVGIHQYVVGALPRTFKLLAGIAGIHGDKQKGIALLRDDGARGVITSVEARTALSLFLRRESRYGDALSVAESLHQQYPRDFLFWLEVANLRKDMGDAAGAIAEYRGTLAQSRKPGFFPNARLQLAWFGLGDTLSGQGRAQAANAAAAFTQALAQPGDNPALRSRATLRLGMEYDLLGQRDKAVSAYRAVLDAGDSAQTDQARRFLKSPYTG